jgi:hypothetical protein
MLDLSRRVRAVGVLIGGAVQSDLAGSSLAETPARVNAYGRSTREEEDAR